MVLEEEKIKIEGFTECELFFAIDAIGGIIWRTNHDVSHDRYEMTPDLTKHLNDLRLFQQHCVDQLPKFGIEPESTKDSTNGDYWKWYRHWNNWKEGMDNDTWRVLDRKMSSKEDYSDMLPKHGWNESE
jgi:hypothetical protein